MVKDILPGATGSMAAYPTVCNGALFFIADDGINGSELWVTDGTQSGTTMVKNIAPGSASSTPVSLTAIGNTLYFSATTAATGYELWTSDGTTAGTQMIKDIIPGAIGSVSYPMFVPYSGKTYFRASDGFNGLELWTTDGTEAGTQMVKDINVGAGNSYPGPYCVYNNKLYFLANDGINGYELWVSDGTTAGTQMFKDLNPGANDGSPDEMFVYKKHMYFTAIQNPLGRQFWISDGTATGTKIIAPPIAPISHPANGSEFFLFDQDSALYVSAYFTSAGRELWSIKDTTSYPNSISSITSQNAFTIYPNPSDGIFTLQLGNTNFQHGSITVYDVTGKLVYMLEEIPQTPIHKVKIEAPKGIYLLKLQLDDAIQTKQIAIE
jgi:ELWxxDGT repeat protein